VSACLFFYFHLFFLFLFGLLSIRWQDRWIKQAKPREPQQINTALAEVASVN
jgi:hypothetical protein